MDLAKLMETTPESLAQVQYRALLEHVLARLDQVKHAIKAGDMDEVRKHTFYSPAGDGMGQDNTCINFAYRMGRDHEVLDIEQVCCELTRLAKLAELPKPKVGKGVVQR